MIKEFCMLSLAIALSVSASIEEINPMDPPTATSQRLGFIPTSTTIKRPEMEKIWDRQGDSCNRGSCADFKTSSGYGNCEKIYKDSKICYLNEPTTCKDADFSKGAGKNYSWEACAISCNEKSDCPTDLPYCVNNVCKVQLWKVTKKNRWCQRTNFDRTSVSEQAECQLLCLDVGFYCVGFSYSSSDDMCYLCKEDVLSETDGTNFYRKQDCVDDSRAGSCEAAINVNPHYCEDIAFYRTHCKKSCNLC